MGAPNATQQNIERLNTVQDTLSFTRIMTNGYGYVGINAGKIPDVWLRRAIIMAMDTTITITTAVSANSSTARCL